MPEGTVLPQTETTSWTVPTGETLATPEGDAYKFALLAIRLLAGDQDARDPGAIARVSPVLGALARSALSSEPGRRPRVGDWITPLEEAMPVASVELPGQRFARATRNPRPAPAAPAAQPMGPPPPGWPAQPGPPAPPRPRRRWVRTVVLVGLLVIAACWGGSAALTRINSAVAGGAPGPAQVGPPADTSSGYQEAQTLEQLLINSKRDRGQLNQGIQQVDGCRDLDGGVAAIQRAANGRGTELNQARTLAVDALPNGAAVQSTLIQALGYSLAADRAFLAWATNYRATNCASSARRNADYQEALRQSDLADQPKQTFVDLWNPIARQFGLASTNLTEADV